MVYTSPPLQHTNNNDQCNHNDCSSKKIISLPFCEHDALRLQEIFMACGVHTITTKNSDDGRKIIQTILHSLNYFHNIGCLTERQGLPSFVCDIAKHVALEQTQNNLLIDLEAFLTVHPCFDFIWIELSQTMQKKYPMQDLIKIFEMYHVQERMPVVFVLYDQE